MAIRNGKRWVQAAAMLGAAALAPPAQAQDFFSGLFGGFGRSRAPAIQMPSFGENFRQAQPRPRSVGGQAWCVRTCDGRYFPITGNDGEARANSCDNLCPTSETEIVYGNTIDSAATEKGKPYSRLPNAFRYRNELVAGCSCNGKDPAGLARIDAGRDPTLRKGDVVAGEDGLVVANRSADKRGAPVEFSPASERIKARFRPPPVVAKGKD